MNLVTALLTNKAYGYPRGSVRRRKPSVLAVLHQTANASAGPIDERNYANRAGSMGPSATAYVGRDGTVVRAIDPTKYAAWSQGDIAHPDALAQAIEERALTLLQDGGSSAPHGPGRGAIDAVRCSPVRPAGSAPSHPTACP